MTIKRDLMKVLPLEDLEALIKEDIEKLGELRNKSQKTASIEEKRLLFEEFRRIDEEVVAMLAEISSRISEMKAQNEFNKFVLEKTIKAKYGPLLGAGVIYAIRIAARCWYFFTQVREGLQNAFSKRGF